MEHYLVSYEYGTGTVWGYVNADGPHEVLAYMPEVDVWEEPPASLDTEDLEIIASRQPIAVDTPNALDALLATSHGLNVAIA